MAGPCAAPATVAMRHATTLCFASVALAGCFDFNALRQPLDGGVSVADDLASVATDLSSVHDLAASDSGGVAAPTPRLIAQAWFSNASGTTYASTAGMLQTQFEIPTAGIVDGDLVLFIGSIDNGSNTPDKIAIRC